MEFIEPRNIIELKKLRICIKKIKIGRELEKLEQIIFNSYEGSNKLTEKIVNREKNHKIVSK